jgi:hypothetical protein
MANQEHLDIRKQGVEVWNQWRQEHTDIRPDLRDADPRRADLTDPRSIPQELAFIVPTLPSVPVQPILRISQRGYGILEHFTRFPWVLPIYRYTDQVGLLHSLKENVIDPAEQKAQDLAKASMRDDRSTVTRIS